MKISTQGQQASYHDIARKKYFDDESELLGRDSFAEVFDDVKSARASYGVVAIENSLYGSIHPVYDLLLDSDCFIIGEIYLRISHCLIGQPSTELGDIDAVYSQSFAIAQCQKWLDRELPGADVHETHDTAASVELVKKTGAKNQAAIASAESAKLHDMKVLATQIETNHHNYTRFIVISKQPEVISGADKTSIILKTAHKPGSLYEVLGEFNSRSINLTKLESRPTPGKPWEYLFYLDFESGMEESVTQDLIATLNQQGHDVQVLGSYLADAVPKS